VTSLPALAPTSRPCWRVPGAHPPCHHPLPHGRTAVHRLEYGRGPCGEPRRPGAALAARQTWCSPYPLRMHLAASETTSPHGTPRPEDVARTASWAATTRSGRAPYNPLARASPPRAHDLPAWPTRSHAGRASSTGAGLGFVAVMDSRRQPHPARGDPPARGLDRPHWDRHPCGPAPHAQGPGHPRPPQGEREGWDA
jgi:hypothetical protein